MNPKTLCYTLHILCLYVHVFEGSVHTALACPRFLKLFGWMTGLLASEITGLTSETTVHVCLA